MIDATYRYFHWSSSLVSALPIAAPYLIASGFILIVDSSPSVFYNFVFPLLSLIGVFVLTVAKHYAERFRIEKEHLVRKTGFFHTKTTTLPYEKIASIDTAQTKIQQYLNIVSLHVRSSSNESIDLRGVKRDVKEALDTQIQTFYERRLGTTSPIHSNSIETKPVLDDTGELLYRLSFVDGLKIGIVLNIFLALIFTFLLTIYRQFIQPNQDTIVPIVERVTGVEFASNQSYVFIEFAYEYFPWIALHLNYEADWLEPLVISILLIVLFVLVLFLFSLLLVWFFYHGFRLSLSDDNIEITTSGIVSVNRKIPLNKIQFVQRISTLRHRVMNSESVTINTTSSDLSRGFVVRLLRDWIVPIARPAETKQVAANVFQHISFDKASWCNAVQKSWLRRFKKHLAIWFLISCILVLISPVFVTLSILILPLLAFEAKKFVASLRYCLSSNAILLERGWWVRRSTVIPLRKIQSVGVIQSRFDRNHQVATLSVSTAAKGWNRPEIKIPYVNYEEVNAVSTEIFKYLLDHRFDG